MARECDVLGTVFYLLEGVSSRGIAALEDWDAELHQERDEIASIVTFLSRDYN